MANNQKIHTNNSKNRQKTAKNKKIDKIVRGVMIYWVAFVSIGWITYWVKDSVPDTLIQYGLGGGAVELVLSAIIEIMRDKYSKEDKS